MLEKKEMAIDFHLEDENGKLITLSEYKGKRIVLYFYPKDLTSGCTTEALSFKEDFEKYQNNNTIIIGISKDSKESHKKFKEKYNLPFILVSDPELNTIKSYEAWGEKSLYGKKYMGVLRVTYIIDENFMIQNSINKVNVKNASSDVCSLLNIK